MNRTPPILLALLLSQTWLPNPQRSEDAATAVSIASPFTGSPLGEIDSEYFGQPFELSPAVTPRQ